MGFPKNRKSIALHSVCQSVSFFALLLLFCIVISTPPTNVAYAETANKTRVYGYVYDYTTRQPLTKAQISCYSNGQEELIAETNSSGFFEAYVNSFGRYTFLAYQDNMSTPGIDYVPAYKQASVEDSPFQVSFSLLPGASINATEDPFFSFEDSVFSCDILDENGLLKLTGSVDWWWEWRSETEEQAGWWWDFRTQQKYRTITVPANTKVRIQVTVYKSYESSGEGFRPWNLERTATFSVPLDGSYLNLTQGEQIPLNLRNARLEMEANIEMPERLNATRLLAEKIGVLSSYERVRIKSAEELLRRAKDSLSDGDYVQAHADLYESYMIVTDVREGLLSLFQNSVLAIYFITPFMSLTSSSLGAILFKGRRRRIAASIVLYGFFIAMLFFAYPGYVFVQNRSYNPLAGTFLEPYIVPLLLVPSLLLGLILVNGPYTYGENADRTSLRLRSAIVASFSLAADNLKRRKLRTFLAMLFMLISVFAFIITTSYSYEEGFVIKAKKGTPPSEGILVCQQAINSRVLPFGPVEERIIQWLNTQPEVVRVVPLLMNVPQIGTPPPPLEHLFKADLSLNYSVSGLLGVIPRLEVGLTKIDQIVGPEEDAGRFLTDADIDGILISQEAKEALNIGLNDTVRFCDRNLTVVGIFSSRKLGEMRDLNGDPVIPQNVRVLQTQGGPVYLPGYVAPEQVVIILGETASELPLNIVVSRVNVQTQTEDDIFSLARSLVLIFPRVETYASMNGEIQHLYVGHYQVVQGFAESTVLLVLMVLNVGTMMLNTVYERRREVVIMSTVGLNPSQTTAIFAAEAVLMAFIAGSLGYFLGLTSCVFLNLLPSPPIIKYKVEAFWSIAALCFSISASVLGSLVPASKASIIATPSLLRRFIITSREKAQEGAWTLDVPLKVKEEDLKGFYDFVEERLKVFNDPIRYEERVDNIVRTKDAYGETRERIYFVYKYSGSKIITENELFSVRDTGSNEHAIKLASRSLLPWTVMGRETSARQTASFTRRIALEYTHRDKI